MENRLERPISDGTTKKAVWILLIAAAVYILIYVTTAFSFFPFETWFDQMWVIKRAEEGTLNLEGLLTVYGEHGMLGENLLFLLNCRLFNLSNEAPAILTSAIPFLLLMILSLAVLKRKETFRNISGIILLAICWMILIPVNSYGTGMNIQVRLSLVFFVLTAVQIDSIFKCEKVHPARIGLLFLSMFLSMNVFGTLYSTAGLPCIFLLMLIGSIRNKEKRRLRIAIMAAYCVFTVLYFYEYGFIGREHPPMELGGSEGALNNLLSQVSDVKNLAKSFLAWCVCGFINQYALNEGAISEGVIYWLGGILLVFYIYAVVVYIKNKQYKSFCLPAFLMGYGLIVWIELLGGRPSGWVWYLGDWYAIHAKMLPLGALLVFGYDYATRVRGDRPNRLPVLRIICFTAVMVIACGIGAGHLWKRAPYAKKWYESQYKYLFVEDERDMPVDENDRTPLCNGMYVTMNGIRTMRDHNLNVYSVSNAYKEINKESYYGSSLEGCHILEGSYGDGWLADKASLQIRTKEEGNIHIDLANLFDAYTGAEGIVMVNGHSYPIQIGAGDFSVEMTAEPNSIVTVDFDFSSFATTASEQDSRVLSLLLRNIYAE